MIAEERAEKAESECQVCVDSDIIFGHYFMLSPLSLLASTLSTRSHRESERGGVAEISDRDSS